MEAKTATTQQLTAKLAESEKRKEELQRNVHKEQKTSQGLAAKLKHWEEVILTRILDIADRQLLQSELGAITEVFDIMANLGDAEGKWQSYTDVLRSLLQHRKLMSVGYAVLSTLD